MTHPFPLADLSSLSFAHPAAWWVLLGLPAVVAIHFLQRRSKRQVITTLFLLETMRRESETGRRFERWRTSIPFWLQILMVLLLTWLLLGPRWQRRDSVQRVAVVLDDSASMSAFRPKAIEALPKALGSLSRVAQITEYTVLTTAPEAPPLYHGTALNDVMAALNRWQPTLGTHDVTPSLRLARQLSGPSGVVVLVTDEAPKAALDFQAKPLAVGEAKENVGFAGASVELAEKEAVFTALIRNFGKAAQSRTWWIETGQGKSAENTVEIPPGQTRTIQAPFPSAVDRCTLVLAGDALTLDDRLPLIRPRPKVLSIWLPTASKRSGTLLQEIFSAFDHTRPASGPTEADLLVENYDPLAPALPDANACVFAADPQPSETYVAGTILAEPDPLVTGLNWQSLLVRETLGLPRTKDDRPLLWQGERPLVSLRSLPSGKSQLLFNFDLESSNARKLPAFAVLLHRFIEGLRQEKIAPEAANFDCNQSLTVAHRTGPQEPPLKLVTGLPGSPDRTEKEIPLGQKRLLRAPAVPGFFELKQGAMSLLTGAAHFADPRESDLTQASAKDEVTGLRVDLVESHSESDGQWRLWTLLLLLAWLASWWYIREGATSRKGAGMEKAGAPT